MNFTLDAELAEAKDALRRYLENEVAPLVSDYEAESRPVPQGLLASLREFGLIGGQLPEEQGGLGLSMTAYGTLIAEVARVWPSLRSCLSVTNIAASVIADGGGNFVKEEYLSKVLTGEALACFALSEPGIGSDAANVQTTAVKTPTGWRINGRKVWISNGPVCNFGVVFARTSLPHEVPAVSCLLFERDTPGLSVSPIRKMGMHSCTLGELLFADVEVPDRNLIGGEGRGFALAKKWLNQGRCVAAFAALGIAEAALEAAITFAKERIQFGKPIGSFQLVQELIADMMTMVETSRLLCYRAALAVDQDSPDKNQLCSMAKRFVTDSALKVADAAIQVHGGAGYTAFFPVERYYRDVRHLSIAEGTNQIQALLIAQSALGLSALR